MHYLLGTRQLSGPEEYQWRNFLHIRDLPWLSAHRIQKQIIFPAAGYIAAALEAALLMADDALVNAIELSDITIAKAITFPDDNASVETIVTLHRSYPTASHQSCITVDFTFHAALRPDSDKLNLACSGRIHIFLSDADYAFDVAPSLDTIPNLDNPVSVETDYFYSFLSELGYGYSDTFKTLSRLERSFNGSKALLRHPDRKAHGFLMHPGTLDNCFQAIMLAIGYPGDGVFHELHVPTRIRRITVDAGKCHKHLESESQLQVFAACTKRVGVTFNGDAHLLTVDCKDTIMRVEGLEITPISGSPVTPHIFSSFVWKTSVPKAELAPISIAPDPALHELLVVSQRACLHYMQLAKNDINKVGLEQAPAHYKHFASYIEHILDRVVAGEQAVTEPGWLQTSKAEIAILMSKYSHDIVIRTIRAVGENLAAAIRGECDMLEPLMRDGLLDEYYAKSTGMAEGSESLAALVRQISHRYPRMNILEVGAGTGGATKSILTRDLQFGSYTFTDVSMGFFEKARATFCSFEDSMNYRILDISSDIAKQGFIPHSYDVIVASCVLHATSSLDVTLRNCYTLLKPGGWLLMLEQTDHRVLCALASYSAAFLVGGSVLTTTEHILRQ
jgi:hybrid polyketide synthase/nonribosomal peptide synthetase ACE1